MAYYDRLVFNKDELIRKIELIAEEAFDKACEVILTNEYFDEAKDINNANYKSYREFVANDVKAWIVEYGSGEHADMNRNPYWGEYTSKSDAYNHYRGGGNHIYSWDKGKNFWDSVYGREYTMRNHGGIDLTAKNRDMYGGEEPTPFIQDLLNKAYDTFANHFNAETSKINLNDYFIVTRERV